MVSGDAVWRAGDGLSGRSGLCGGLGWRGLAGLSRGRLLLALLLLAWAGPLSALQPSPVVTLPNGSPLQGHYAKGKNGKETTEFLGIPYAEAPVGNLRFRQPVRKARWAQVLNATRLPNSCVQTKDAVFGDFFGADMWNANTKKSEDCLYLNVWVPGRIEPSRRTQVMIWVYGGGFWSGTSSLPVYDGKILASEENVIVVSMNYRVTLFGFLYLGRADAPGNQGLWDQQLAFKWVQENIEAFGGSAEGVTIFGESAGAASVSMHVLSQASAPYFERAVMQSSTATAPWAMERRGILKERVILLAQAVGCNVTIKDKNPDLDRVMDCLRAAPADKLRNEEWITYEFCDFPWTPVVDGEFFTEDPKTSLQRGNFKKSQILLGTNYDEANFFIVYDVTSVFAHDRLFSESEFITSDELFVKAAKKLLPRRFWANPAVRDAILFEYKDWALPGSALRRQNALDKMMGDYHFTCSVNEFAQWYNRHGGSVYYYYFTHRASAQTWPEWMGVLHGYEINFVFGEPLNTLDYSYTPAERELSRRFMRYWANFARTGNPNKNPDGSWMGELWPAFTEAEEYAELTLNRTRSGHGPRRRQCAFWKHYVPALYTATSSLTEMEAKWKEGFRRWEQEYIVDWQYHFHNYKRYQQHRRDDLCAAP